MKAIFFNKIRDNRQNRGMKPSFQSFDKKRKKHLIFALIYSSQSFRWKEKNPQAYFVSKINA